MQHDKVRLHSDTACFAAGDMLVKGTAAVFYDPTVKGTEYQVSDNIYFRVMPTAFDAPSVMSGDVVALFNHDNNQLLGRTPSTLKLSVSPKGLEYSIDLPDTSLGRDIFQLVKRGDLRGSSWSGTFDYTHWEKDGDRQVKNIVRVKQLIDVSPVVHPAFGAATVGFSSDFVERLVTEFQEWNRLQMTKARIEARLHR